MTRVTTRAPMCPLRPDSRRWVRATWRITGLTAPTPGQDGEIRGRVAFEAVVLVQEREDILAPTFLRRVDGTTTVHADFVTPIRYRFSTIELPF